MRTHFAFFLLGFLILGCDADRPSASAPGSAPAPSPRQAVRFTIAQRSTMPVPKFDGEILLTIDDITSGQALVTLSRQAGQPIIATRSMQPGDSVPFTLDNVEYRLQLINLMNVLMGKDTAEFQIGPPGPDQAPETDDDARIVELLARIEKQPDLVFLRNGQEHTAVEAAAHMRKKWEWKRSEVKTVEDFIREVASKSETTGEPYLIRLPDGSELPAEQWLRTQFEDMKGHI